jgi:hypothetical protein
VLSRYRTNQANIPPLDNSHSLLLGQKKVASGAARTYAMFTVKDVIVIIAMSARSLTLSFHASHNSNGQRM